MNLLEFFTTGAADLPPEAWRAASVFWFKGLIQAPRCVEHCARLLGRLFSLPVAQLYVEDLDTFKATLAMSFLGQSQLYLVRGAHELSASAFSALTRELQQYVGPHRVVIASDSVPKGAWSRTFEGKVTRELYTALARSVGGDSIDPRFLERVLESGVVLSPDVALGLLEYQQALGARSEDFFVHWLERLALPERSLFTLSQYFFARDRRQFLALWIKVRELYVPEYWTIYWSDQLWQAALFVEAAKREGSTSARRLVTRLPFSFINKDWRQTSLAELARAHAFLYDVEFRLKTSVAGEGVELFCIKFLQQDFK